MDYFSHPLWGMYYLDWRLILWHKNINKKQRNKNSALNLVLCVNALTLNARAKRTDQQQLAELDRVFGKGNGAKKERARLKDRIRKAKEGNKK